MPIREGELKWIFNRRKIFRILLDVSHGKLSVLDAEKKIRSILYSEPKDTVS